MQRRALFLCALFALSVEGCVNQYSLAMDRGDYFATAGDWENAAGQYELAAGLDPESPEAAARLRGARRHQVAQRAQAIRARLARGEVEAALELAEQAMKLDPGNPEARAAEGAAHAAALQRGEELLSGGQAREALALATRVRKAQPNHPGALALEARARDTLAAEAYARAEALLAQRTRASALLAFLDVERVRPGYRDAAERAGALRRELEGELQYHIVLERTAGEPRDLAEAVDRELPVKLLDKNHPQLTIDRRAPGPNAMGMTVALRVEGYAMWDKPTSRVRTCNYVCGIDRVPNPAHPVAVRAADMAGARVHDAEAEATHAQRDVDRKRHARDAMKVEKDNAERSQDRARRDLAECRAASPPNKDPSERCRKEEQAHRAAEDAVAAVSGRLKLADGEVDGAEDRAGRAGTELTQRKRDFQLELEHLGRTPQILEVERTCTDSFPITTHNVQATVGLVLRAGLLGGDPARELPSVPYNVVERDETFEPRPGRCSGTAAGDPLTLPSEAQMRQSLASRVVEGARGSVHGSYEAYRQDFLNEERRELAAGHEVQAVEAHVRWLLLGPEGESELRSR